MFLVLLLPSLVLGHGNMVWPPVWWDVRGEVGLGEGQHCSAGHQYIFYDDPGKAGVNCMWYTNFTHIVGESTLDPSLWTFPNIEEGYKPYIAHNPWRAPGSAPIYTPCGAAGGNPLGCPEGAPPGPGQDCGQPYGGAYAYGPKAENMEFEDPVTTEWVAGANEVVGWGMSANHGGGYSYRLCKLPEGGKAELTEECFQRTPLRFASEYSWAQYGGSPDAEKVYFLANRTSEGTTPPGSQWAKNPIPNCVGLGGGFFDEDPSCPKGTQFPPPAPGLLGQGANIHTPGKVDFLWSLMDEVEVPEELVPGDYVLSFRWDCEQTPQVWNACSNIRIVSPQNTP